MARIRSIKPELRTSITVSAWPFEVRYFFVLLWGYLDDYGRGVDDGLLIAADCFPRDRHITADTIDGWLNVVEEAGPVHRYEVDGKPYLHCPSWGEHQKPQHPGKPRVPPCPECEPDPFDGWRAEHPAPRARGRSRKSREDLMSVSPPLSGAPGRPSEGVARGCETPLEGVVIHMPAPTPGNSPECDETAGQDTSHATLVRISGDTTETLTPEQGYRSREQGEGDRKAATRNVADAAPTRADVDQACTLLADLIEANGTPRPAITQRWRDAARLMIDRDHIDLADVLGAIRWSQADEFWRCNVLSMPKLRKQYPTLRLQALRGRNQTLAPTGTDARIAEHQAVKAQMAAAMQQQHHVRELPR